jgi:hypothetical protein
MLPDDLAEPSSTLTILALDDPAVLGANHLNGAIRAVLVFDGYTLARQSPETFKASY